MKKIEVTHYIKDGYDELDFEATLKCKDMLLALYDVRMEIFRPHRKHGYGNTKIQDLINSLGEDDNKALELISLLEEMFNEILENHGLDIERLCY